MRMSGSVQFQAPAEKKLVQLLIQSRNSSGWTIGSLISMSLSTSIVLYWEYCTKDETVVNALYVSFKSDVVACNDHS